MSFTDTKVYVLTRDVQERSDITVKKYLGVSKNTWCDSINDIHVKFYTSLSDAEANKIAWSSVFTEIKIEEF